MLMKILSIVLGVLGEFLKLAMDRAGANKALFNTLAGRAKYHAIALANSQNIENDEKRAKLVTLIKADAASVGRAVKDNAAGIIAELAVAAAKKELADQLRGQS